MIIEAASIPARSTLQADVCIVGAGPAGMMLAASLLGRGLNLIVLESGRSVDDPRAKELGSPNSKLGPDCYPGVRWATSRGPGGTSAQWDVEHGGVMNAHVGVFDQADFTAKPWAGIPEWPITPDTLAPYYAQVCQTIGVGGASGPDAPAGTDAFRPERWTGPGRALVPTLHSGLTHAMLLVAPQTAFQQTIPQRLATDPDASLITGATVTALHTSADGSTVERVTVRASAEHGFEVSARCVLLAMGGYEVPRLLLASDGVHAAGIGNDHDLVGRFLSDRQLVNAGMLKLSGPQAWRTLSFLDNHLHAGDILTRGKLMVAPEERLKQQLLSSIIWFTPREAPGVRERLLTRAFGRGTTARSAGVQACKAMMRAMRERQFGPELISHAARALGNFDDILFERWGRLLGQTGAFNRDSGGWSEMQPEVAHARFTGMEVSQLCEQSPHPDNRIVLGDERDALGMRQSVVHMATHAADRQSALRTQALLAREFQRLGVGTLRSETRDGEPLYFQVSSHHPSGATRMSADPRQGVVDADCQVHGVRNLFVASSSVFPSGGAIPPTLTIMALATRLADTVLARLRDGTLPGLARWNTNPGAHSSDIDAGHRPARAA